MTGERGHLRALPDPEDDQGVTPRPPRKRKRRYYITRKDGTRAYPVRYTKPDGSVGQETFDSAEAADSFRAEVRAKKRLGVSVDTATMVEHLAKHWGARYVRKQSDKTQLMHAGSLTNRILPWGGDKRVMQWTRQTTKDFIHWLEDHGDVRACRRDDGALYGRWDRVPVDHPERRPAGAATIRQTMQTLSLLMQHGMDRGLLAANPAERAKRPAEVPTERRALTMLEMRLLGEACQALDRARDRTLVIVAAFTGMRQQDIRALEWRDIDFEVGVISVRRAADHRGQLKRTKSGKESVRRVPLLAPARAALDRWRLDTPVATGLVFPSQRGSILSPSNFRRDSWLPMKRAAARGLAWELSAEGATVEAIDEACASLLALTFHELRHTFISMVGSSGKVPQSVGMAWSGHRSPAMWKRYEHLFDDASKRAAESFDSWLGERSATPDHSA